MTELAVQVARKMKLENTFKPEVKRFFNQLNKDVEIGFIATGGLIDISSYRIDLISLLKNHYRRIAKVFSNDIRETNKNFTTKQDDEDSNEELLALLLLLSDNDDVNIDNQVREYIDQRSFEQSGYILDTTNQDLITVTSIAIANSLLSEEQPTIAETARQIKIAADKKSDGRINVIAETETQQASERIKLIEAVAVGAIVAETTKTWNAIFDNKTRSAHARADNQKRPVNEPFLVGGQFMDVPSDTSLGASLDNVINCRCTATYGLS